MKIGSMTLTRDSAWWGVSAALSFAAVLATLPDPSGPMSLAYYGIPASWLPYVRLLALINTWLSGKMSKSPAPSSGEVARGFRDNGTPILLLLVIALGASGCASLGGARHTATVSVVTAHAVLSAVQDTEMGLVCGRVGAPLAPACVPESAHRTISADLRTAFGLDQQVAALVRAVPAGAPTPTEALALVGQIAALVDRVLARIPASSSRAALIQQIGSVQ